MNRANMPVLALDLPSGLHPDTGVAAGPCFRARQTVTFAAPKPGFWLREGPACCGGITVADIGCPRELLRDE